ncbi:MAG: hypothetical protein PHO15_06050, partial [Eubacteriales bacterium]|nr:hypothetical protein [Eubacteriales bacterium]
HDTMARTAAGLLPDGDAAQADTGTAGADDTAATAGNGAGAARYPEPMLYAQGSEVYLSCGKNTVPLGQAQILSPDENAALNAMCSYDNSVLYYLCDVDEKTGVGALMRVLSDAASVPELIADDVCAAAVSESGEKALYITDEDDGMGVLCLYDGGNTEVVASSAVPESFGFSSNGENIYYVGQAQGGDAPVFTLYMKIGGGMPRDIKKCAAGQYNDIFQQVFLGDDGKILYNCWDAVQSAYSLFLKSDGVNQKIGTDAFVLRIFGGADDFLYHSDTSLYYKAPEEAKVRLSENYDIVVFPQNLGYDDSGAPEKRFLLVENKGDGKITLYDQAIGEDKVKIADADGGSYIINPDFTWAAFMKEGRAYLAQKTDNEWSEPRMACDNAVNFAFATDGGYYYYIAGWGDGAVYGDLYRYSLSSEASALLQYDVTAIDEVDGVLYSITTEGQIYRVDGIDDLEKLTDGACISKGTFGGLHIIIGPDSAEAYDICYYDGESVEVVFSGAELILDISGAIEHVYPALPADAQTYFEELYEDAQYILAVYERDGCLSGADDDEAHRSWLNSLELLETLKEREDILPEAQLILTDYYFGFMCVELSEIYNEDAYYLELAAGYLQSAARRYENLMGYIEEDYISSL